MQANADSVQFGVESDHAAHRQALAPVLLGLLAPMLLFMLIDPRALSSISVIAPVYLFAIFVIASAAYLISVFENGEVTRITFRAGISSTASQGRCAPWHSTSDGWRW